MANDFTADLTTAFQLDPARDMVPPMPLGEVGRMTAVAHPHGGRTLAFEYSRPFN
jgi:hypothetical protein